MSGEKKEETIDILDERSPWDGIGNKYDQSYARTLSRDKIFAMPCLNELKVFGSFDKENSGTDTKHSNCVRRKFYQQKYKKFKKFLVNRSNRWNL